MIFQRCMILGFGKLTDTFIAFEDRLNVVFSQNEGGKTTLQRCLVGLLYGQLRPDLKTQRRVEAWVDQYRPWHASQYEGILWCRMSGGREFEIQRNFGKEDYRVIIRTASGEDVTSAYEQQRNGEVLFARSHLELPKDLFESVAVIRESRLSELESSENIRDRIANLAQFGDEELSIRRSLNSLEGALAAVGTDRAPTKPYRQVADRLEALRTEAKRLQSRQQEHGLWLSERNRFAGEVAHLEKMMAAAQQAVLSARKRETAEKVRVLQEIENEVRSLRCETESLAADPNFPIQDLEEMEQLMWAMANGRKSLEEIRNGIRLSSQRFQKLDAEKSEMRGYAELLAVHDADRITEWFVGYLGLIIQRDKHHKSILQLQDEISDLHAQLEQLPPPLQDPAVDWPRKVIEASEEERASSQRILTLTERLSQARAGLASARRRRLVRQAASATMFILALAALAGIRVSTLAWLSPPILGVCALACGAASLLFWIAASRCRKAEPRRKQEVADTEAEVLRIRAAADQLYSEVHQVMAQAGYRSVDDFISQAELSSRQRQRIRDLGDRVRETEQQRDKASNECESIYENLKACLARVGLSCSPANVRAQVDVLRTSLRRYRELEESCRNRSQQLDALRLQEQQLIQDLEIKQDRLQAILGSAGVDSPESFRQGCRSRQRLLALREKEAAGIREFNRHCDNLTLEQWVAKLRDIEAQEQSFSESSGEAATQTSAPEASLPGSRYLPYLPSAEETEREAAGVASLLGAAREEYTRISERVRQAFHGYRTPSEIDEDLALAEAEMRRLEINRRALETALEILRILAREQQEVLAPQLNRAVEGRFLRLSQQRYVEVKIDPDLNLLARETATAQLRSAETLSRGTQDQLYLALRFGILDLLSSPLDSCPCLMDEPFAAYDRIRMSAAFRVLEEESQRRQLILFTCREDVLEAAIEHGAHVIRLPDTNCSR